MSTNSAHARRSLVSLIRANKLGRVITDSAMRILSLPILAPLENLSRILGLRERRGRSYRHFSRSPGRVSFLRSRCALPLFPKKQTFSESSSGGTCTIAALGGSFLRPIGAWGNDWCEYTRGCALL